MIEQYYSYLLIVFILKLMKNNLFGLLKIYYTEFILKFIKLIKCRILMPTN
jgi:hypothetical protein